MNDQLNFDSDPALISIQQRFERFHREHPEVYVLAVELARTGKAAGRTRLSINQIFEVMRWQRSIEGLPDDREDYKINSVYASRYARLIMEQEPDLEGIFEIRRLLRE